MQVSIGKSIGHAGGILARTDAALGALAAIPAALFVAAEIILLFVGVVARYVFHHPLIWGDELAEILFLWLAMLGAAVALHRGLHMRMTAIVNKAGPRRRHVWEKVSLTASLTFLFLLLEPTLAYFQQQEMMTTLALGLPDQWRVAAVVAGIVLMILMCLVQHLAVGQGYTACSVVFALGVAILLHYTTGAMTGLGNANLVIFFVLIVAGTVLSGMPIAFSFGLATFSYLSLSTSMPLQIVVSQMDGGMSQILLLAVPMFIFLGLLIEMTGMAKAMIDFLASLLGGVRGGLSYVLVGAMYLVSGISGSKTADMAAVTPVLFPEMVKRGEKPGELVALLSATGAQTETVPPSIVLIAIGSVTGVSISALFTGGLLPGLILGLLLCVLVWLRSRHQALPATRGLDARRILRAFVYALPALLLPIVIRVAVVEGIATATEVSALGVFYAIVAGILVYRRFDTARLYAMCVETAALSGAILLIIGAATAMSWALTQSGFSASLAQMMSELPGGKWAFMAMSIVLFVVLGSVLEGIPAIVLFGPLLFPIAGSLHLNEVHYSMVVILSMGLGLFAPPFGVGYYGACTVAKVHPDEGIRPIAGYMIMLAVGIVIVAAVPWISTGFL
jgi:tripartite ATP-independent transporter DctM subunit